MSAAGRRAGSLFVALLGWASASAAVTPSVPWTPQPATRSALELLVDDAGLDLTVMQWPLPRQAVVDALDALPADLPADLALARDRVRADLRRQASAELSATVRPHVDVLASFGDDASPGSSAELRTGDWQSAHVALQAGMRVEAMSVPSEPGSALRLDDSAAVVGIEGWQLQAWAHRSWWGPGWQSALALSNNAPALNAIGLQRSSASRSASPWLSWLGPWSFESFIGRSERYADPGSPFILGGRLEFRPFSHLDLGLEYTAQWGGAGRRQTFKSLLEMITGHGVNADTVAEQADDPGNGLAGYDARLRCPDFLRCAAYGQAIGEDMAGGLPSRFLAMGGVEVWSADGSQRVFVEDSRTAAYRAWFGPPLTDYAYRNYAYPDGYTDDHRWLGANVGPDARVTTLGWIDSDIDAVVKLSLAHIGSRVGSYSPVTFDPRWSGRMLGVSAKRSIDWAGATWTPQVDWFRLAAPAGVHQDTRVGLSMALPLDDLARGAASRWDTAFADVRHDPAVAAFASVGVLGAAALFDRIADNYAVTHGRDTPSLLLRHAGPALPWLGLGAAGVAGVGAFDDRSQAAGIASVEAGMAALAATQAIARASRRAAPGHGGGPDDFGHMSPGRGSFPSLQAALAWGVATPAAQAYDAPWLYGVAAAASVAPVLGRKAWLSDAAAGALLGYWIGDGVQAWRARRADPAAVALSLTPNSVVLSVPWN